MSLSQSGHVYILITTHREHSNLLWQEGELLVVEVILKVLVNWLQFFQSIITLCGTAKYLQCQTST